MRYLAPPPSLVHELVTGIAEIAGVTTADIYLPNRHKSASWARAMVCRWLRAHEAGYSMAGIGRALGINHTSVIDALRRDISPTTPHAVKVKRQSYPRLGQRIEALVSSRGKTRIREMANILDANSNNVSEAVSRLFKSGRIRRVSIGVYAPISILVAPPATVASAILPIAFIRPISKERMMAGR